MNISALKAGSLSIESFFQFQDANDLQSKKALVSEILSFIFNNPAADATIRFTPEGGLAVKMTNKTGGASVKGTIVTSDTVVDSAVKLEPADGKTCIGAMYEDGVADGDECWIVVGGVAEILLKDATASVAGNWVIPSDVSGRADGTATAPPGGDLAANTLHFSEIGHCLEANAGGVDQLIKIMMHFN